MRAIEPTTNVTPRTTIRSRVARTRLPRRLALSSLGFAGFSLLLAACSAPPTENTGTGESRVSGALLTISSPTGQITNGNGGCLDLPNGDTTNGNLLHVWSCDSSGFNQTWYVDGAGAIHYAANPTKCIDFPAQDLSNGVPVDMTQLQLWDCNGASGPDQVWRFSWTGQIEFAADTAKCVELRNGSSANGTPVQVYDCNGTSGQTWQLLAGANVQGFQLQDGNGACLDAPSAASGTGLVLDQCNSTGANQTWSIDGTGTLHPTGNSGVCLTFPAQDWTTSGVGFVPASPVQIQNCNELIGQAVALSPSSHDLVVGGKACVEARDGSSTNGTIVEGFNCNGTTGQTWFPRVVDGTCPGTVAGNGTCNACGGVGGAPCAGTQVGCNSGLVSADTPQGALCESACGTLGNYACTSSENNPANGGCTQLDTVRGPSFICEWNPACGHAGQGCCDAGSAFQTPNGSGPYNQVGATQDTCHDGSICSWWGNWSCHWPDSTSGGGSVCSGGGAVEGFPVCCDCDGENQGLTEQACTAAAALSEANEATGCYCQAGACPQDVREDRRGGAASRN
jgi:hypothetical protein